MAEIVPKEKTTKKAPQVQDMSQVVDQTGRAIQDLDHRLQLMRNDLQLLFQKASALQASGVGNPISAFGQGGASPYGAATFGSFANWGSPWPGAADIGSTWGTPYAAAAYGAPQAMGNTMGSIPQGVPGASPLLGGQGQMAPGFTRDLRSLPPVNRQPSGDIIDVGDAFQVDLEMPGVNKDDLDLVVTDNALIVTALVSPDIADGVVVVGERRPIQYRRHIPLPSEIQASNCKASLKDGILTVNVPKKVPTEGPRHVSVAYA